MPISIGRVYPDHYRDYDYPGYQDFLEGDIISYSSYQIVITDTREVPGDCDCELRITEGTQTQTVWVPYRTTQEVLDLEITDRSHCPDTYYDDVVCIYEFEAPGSTCQDSDGGSNSQVKGYVDVGGSLSWDRCTGDSLVCLYFFELA